MTPYWQRLIAGHYAPEPTEEAEAEVEQPTKPEPPKKADDHREWARKEYTQTKTQSTKPNIFT